MTLLEGNGIWSRPHMLAASMLSISIKWLLTLKQNISIHGLKQVKMSFYIKVTKYSSFYVHANSPFL